MTSARTRGDRRRQPAPAGHGMTFLKNWLTLLTSDMLGLVLSFLSVIRLARHLNPEGYGVYAVALSTASLFSLAAGAGLQPVIVTEIAKRHDAAGRILRPVLRIRLASVPAAALLLVSYYLFSDVVAGPTIILISLWMLVNLGILELLDSVAFGQQVMGYSAMLNVLNSVVWIAGLYVIPLERLTALNALAYFALLQSLQSAIYAVLLGRAGFFGSSPFHYHLSARQMLRKSWPYLWMNLMGVAFVQGPVLLLARYSGTAEVGLYNAGYRLVLPLSLLIGALGRAMLPFLVAARQESESRFNEQILHVLGAITVLGGMAALITTAGAPEGVRLVFGGGYVEAVPTVINQVWAMYAYATLVVVGIVLAAMERQQLIARLATAGGGAALLLAVAGSGRGARTLSLLLLAGYLFNLTVHLWGLTRELPGAARRQLLLRVLSTTLFLAAVARLIDPGLPLWQRAGLALAPIAALLAVYRREARLGLLIAGQHAPQPVRRLWQNG